MRDLRQCSWRAGARRAGPMETAGSYTEKMARVQKAIEAMQRGGVDVAEVMRLFEESSALLTACEAQLQEAEGRFRELTGEDAG